MVWAPPPRGVVSGGRGGCSERHASAPPIIQYEPREYGKRSARRAKIGLTNRRNSVERRVMPMSSNGRCISTHIPQTLQVYTSYCATRTTYSTSTQRRCHNAQNETSVPRCVHATSYTRPIVRHETAVVVKVSPRGAGVSVLNTARPPSILVALSLRPEA